MKNKKIPVRQCVGCGEMKSKKEMMRVLKDAEGNITLDMTGKKNIRSIRFSDELAELIDRQAGDTFTQKFEGLITRCVWELPRKEAELEEVQKQIRREKERLTELRKRREKLDQAIRDIQRRLDYHLKELEKL